MVCAPVDVLPNLERSAVSEVVRELLPLHLHVAPLFSVLLLHGDASAAGSKLGGAFRPRKKPAFWLLP